MTSSLQLILEGADEELREVLRTWGVVERAVRNGRIEVPPLARLREARRSAAACRQRITRALERMSPEQRLGIRRLQDEVSDAKRRLFAEVRLAAKAAGLRERLPISSLLAELALAAAPPAGVERRAVSHGVARDADRGSVAAAGSAPLLRALLRALGAAAGSLWLLSAGALDGLSLLGGLAVGTPVLIAAGLAQRPWVRLALAVFGAGAMLAFPAATTSYGLTLALALIGAGFIGTAFVADRIARLTLTGLVGGAMVLAGSVLQNLEHQAWENLGRGIAHAFAHGC